MLATFTQVTKDVMELPAHQRLALAGLLLECEDLPIDSGAEAAWEMEIQSRIAHIDEGKELGVSYEDVMRAAERRLLP
jgi:Putative addiction module component